MKKLLFLTLIFSAIMSTRIYAQHGGAAPAPQAKEAQPAVDPAVMLQQIKDKVKAPMVEQTGLTEAQVDKVIELNFEMRMAMSGFRDLSEADRSAKVAELKAAKEVKFSEFLTADQIQSVKTFYADMGKKSGK